MTPRDIARRRLDRQRLVGAPLAAAGDVVRHFAAVQAQEYAGAAVDGYAQFLGVPARWTEAHERG